jgi:hypothetical protein
MGACAHKNAHILLPRDARAGKKCIHPVTQALRSTYKNAYILSPRRRGARKNAYILSSIRRYQAFLPSNVALLCHPFFKNIVFYHTKNDSVTYKNDTFTE